MAKSARGSWWGLRPAAGRSGRHDPRPRRRPPSRLIESLEDRVLLSADVRSLGLPAVAEVAPLLPTPGFEASEPDEGAGDDWAGLEAGPPAPLAPEESLPNRTLRLARSVRVSTLVVSDGAGNSISSSPSLYTAFKPDDPAQPPEIEFGPPLPGPLDSFPRMPWAPRHIYFGSLGGEDATAIRIPVGPGTRALTLDLKVGHAGDALTPRIENVSLIARGGEVLSQIYGVSFLGEGESQTLFLSIRGAPIGGEIFVLLAPLQTWSSTPPSDQGSDGLPDGDGGAGDGGGGDGGGGAGEAPSWDGASFELDIRRNEADGFAGAPSAETTAVGGTVYVASFGRVDLPISVVPPSLKAEATRGDAPGGPAPRGSVAQAMTRRELQVDPAEDGPVEVFLGPLVSRTAAAMGPALATAPDEPTPSTDRAARPRPEVLAAFGSAVDPGATAPGRGRGEAAPQGDLPLVALRGPGGVPIVVAALRAGDRTPEAEAEAVAASALGAAQDAAPPADPARPEEGEPEIARAGFAGRALGFLVGMGLASGPLYPDLLALARRKFRRVPRRAGGRRRVNAGRA